MTEQLPVLQKLRILRQYNPDGVMLTSALASEIISELEAAETMVTQRIAADPAARIRCVEMSLTPTEWRMLEAMNKTFGLHITYKQVVEVTGCNRESMWVHVRRLRVKLDELKAPFAVVTVRERGYALMDRK